MFICKDLHEAGKWLAVDYRVDCKSTEFGAHRAFAVFAIFLWPVGFPLAFLGLLRYYTVPKIAARKILRAKEAAFLEHALARLLCSGKPLHGVTSKSLLEELNRDQLQQLAGSLGSDEDGTGATAGLLGAIDSTMSTKDLFRVAVQGASSSETEQALPISYQVCNHVLRTGRMTLIGRTGARC